MTTMTHLIDCEIRCIQEGREWMTWSLCPLITPINWKTPQLTMGWIHNRKSPQQVYVVLIHDHHRHDHHLRHRRLH